MAQKGIDNTRKAFERRHERLSKLAARKHKGETISAKMVKYVRGNRLTCFTCQQSFSSDVLVVSLKRSGENCGFVCPACLGVPTLLTRRKIVGAPTLFEYLESCERESQMFKARTRAEAEAKTFGGYK